MLFVVLFTADTKEKLKKKKNGTCPIISYSRFIAVFSLKGELPAN